MSADDGDEYERYLRYQTVAKNLDVTVGTIKRWVAEGKMEAFMLPGVRGYRIPRSSYLKFVNTIHGPKKQESA